MSWLISDLDPNILIKWAKLLKVDIDIIEGCLVLAAVACAEHKEETGVLSCSVTSSTSCFTFQQVWGFLPPNYVFLTQFSLCFKKPWYPLSYWITGLAILSLYFWLFRKNMANLYLQTKDLKRACHPLHVKTYTSLVQKHLFIFMNLWITKMANSKWLLFPSIFWNFFFLHCQLFSSEKKKKGPKKPSSLSLSRMWSLQQEIDLWHCISSFWTWPLLLRHSFCVLCNATMLIPR